MKEKFTYSFLACIICMFCNTVFATSLDSTKTKISKPKFVTTIISKAEYNFADINKDEELDEEEIKRLVDDYLNNKSPYSLQIISSVLKYYSKILTFNDIPFAHFSLCSPQ